ncbi:hypothetical protein [Nostoc sp.]|uniref:hypothetical protein n=1 Tax=Nostoc sp. TaxID=1180 RepID=UPI002FF57CE8
MGSGGDEGDGGNEGDGGDELITNAQCPMPNAQFQIPEKSYTIMSYAGSRG